MKTSNDTIGNRASNLPVQERLMPDFADCDSDNVFVRTNLKETLSVGRSGD
jgi:hypothetical protein